MSEAPRTAARASLAERRWLRLGTLCLLYVAQGIPWGFTAVTIPAYLAEQQVSPAVIGTTLAMTTLPYAFKWVWGPIIDAFTIPRLGRRRPWILLAQLMMAATIFAMIAIPDLSRDLKLLAWMILLHTVFNGLQDVAVDALAVDLLDEDERGRANGLMYASKFAGGALGGAGIGTVVAYYGFDVALVLQTGILLAIMLLPFLVRERPAAASELAAPRPSVGDVVRGLVEAFSVRSALVCALVMLSIQFALGVVTANAFGLYTQELGWKPDEYARLTGGIGLAAGFCGAASGGFLADWLGRRRVAALASIALGLGWLAFALARPAWSSDVLVYGFAIYQTFALSVMTVALFAVCMDLSLPRVAASQFTAYMALANFSTTLGYQAVGFANERWEYHGVYLVAAGVQLAVTSLLLLVDPGETRRVLPRPAGVKPSPLGAGALVALLGLLVAMTIYTTMKTLG
jgi:MFS transporter, PAT family, beta-lactamase induction signal transducer AmpG